MLRLFQTLLDVIALPVLYGRQPSSHYFNPDLDEVDFALQLDTYLPAGAFPVKKVEDEDINIVAMVDDEKGGRSALTAIANFFVYAEKLSFRNVSHVMENRMLHCLETLYNATDPDDSDIERIESIGYWFDTLDAPDPILISHDAFSDRGKLVMEYFDLLKVPLIHCWVVPESLRETLTTFGYSYNTFKTFDATRQVAFRNEYRSSFETYNEKMRKTEPAITWFKMTSTEQCTEYGIREVYDNLEGFAVLFRDNRYSLIWKNEAAGQVQKLVTVEDSAAWSELRID